MILRETLVPPAPQDFNSLTIGSHELSFPSLTGHLGSEIWDLGYGIWDPYRRDAGQKLQPRGRQRVDAVEITEITDSANKFHFDLLLPAYLFR